MLNHYSIKNFKSYKNDTKIDLKSTNYKILQKNNVAENGILKGLMFVGANASGKTNIIIALKTLLELLFKKNLSNLNSYQCFFSQSELMNLNYEFIIDEQAIKYSIQFNTRKGIIIENLELNGINILNRIGNNATVSITDEATFNDLDNDVLLLREIYFNTKFRGNNTLKTWFEFLSNSAYVNPFKQEIFSPVKQTLSLDDYLKKNNVTEINEFLSKYKFNQTIEYNNKASGNNISFETEDKSVFFKRHDIKTPIPFQWESLGNQNLLNILPPFFHVLKHGGLLLIDAFSSGFHNELEELLIKYFLKHSQTSQILFVTHSTNLLSTSILRPDQIYSVDFKGAEGSLIKRFSDEKPREAQNIERMYTSGVFDGLPDYEKI